VGTPGYRLASFPGPFCNLIGASKICAQLVNREHLVLSYVVAEEASNFLYKTLWSRYYWCSLFTSCAYVVVEEANNFL